jgi:hypothetical protein
MMAKLTADNLELRLAKKQKLTVVCYEVLIVLLIIHEIIFVGKFDLSPIYNCNNLPKMGER